MKIHFCKTKEEQIAWYRTLLNQANERTTIRALLRYLGRHDIFFLLAYLLNRIDITRSQWLYERCVEVSLRPNGYLDLWAREHYKSTIITFAKTIQDILCNPESTIGIFSHTRAMALDFVGQIKYELESNQFLISLYSDILWSYPKSEAPIWSLEKGIVVKRTTNPKEATVEGHGLVDGQPTGKHFSTLVYDDIVTRESVSSPEMIHKVTECVSLSLNLGTREGIQRYIGTRYHYNDTYAILMERKSVIPRIYPATTNGRIDGIPVLLTQEQIEKKYRAMGSYVFSCQMLQNPIADTVQCFKKEWLTYYDSIDEECLQEMYTYILVDPAGERKLSSDYSVFIVIGTAKDNKYYLLDAYRERLSLTQKAQTLFQLHERWKPEIVGYEKYGMQCDIEYIYTEQERRNYRFDIVPLGGNLSKRERISQLLPLFERGDIVFPAQLMYTTRNGLRDFIHDFIHDEYLIFPFCKHDDMLDCLARITDKHLDIVFPHENTTLPHTSTIDYYLFGDDTLT